MWSMEFYVYTGLIGILVLWVLLPLIPAVLIYRLFPGTYVAAEGPLAGLTVKAGGAFAAYLIVFVVVMPWVNSAYYVVGGWLHPAWTVTGTLHITDKNGVDSHPRDAFFRNISVRTQPEVNSFHYPTFTITIPEGPRGIPAIYLDTDFGSYSVPIKQGKINSFYKIAELGQAIEIREAPLNDSDDRRLLTVRGHQ